MVKILFTKYLNGSLGDGLCNVETNSEECNYDFGDCCSNFELVGNGICNDEANYPECNYDGGDCCLSNVDTTKGIYDRLPLIMSYLLDIDLAL